MLDLLRDARTILQNEIDTVGPYLSAGEDFGARGERSTEAVVHSRVEPEPGPGEADGGSASAQAEVREGAIPGDGSGLRIDGSGHMTADRIASGRFAARDATTSEAADGAGNAAAGAPPDVAAPDRDRAPAAPVRRGSARTSRIESLIPGDSPLHTMRTLAEVEAYVASARLIALDESRLNPVFGVGNPEADLMVVGEAPGADEDRKGEPFVGRAGQLLDKILEATGFLRSDVYIANILKSRPPNNRNPQPDEIAAHVPILFKQISLIKPRMLLSLGRISACTLVGVQGSLASLRGRVHDFHGFPLVVTYHPAALLRNPEWKRPTWEDMQFLRRKFDELAASA